jgi:hypothetical protein
MSDVTPIKVKATIMYPYLTRLNDRFNADNPKYEVTLANLSDKAVEKIEEMGITVYEKEGMGKKITCKSINEIRAYDSKTGEQVDGDLVGNGSECIVILSAYSNRYGSFPQLSKLTITELKTYEGSDGVGINPDDDDIL